MIDIIIPCYKTENYLHKALCSVAIQSILDKCKITCIVDGESPETYNEIIKTFQPYMDIQLLHYEENKGPGYCRNYGIDNTNDEYIYFMDSDDIFYNAYSLEFLSTFIEDCDMCCGKFILQHSDSFEIINSWNCLHGKLYKRKFIVDNNIRMSNIYIHEDVLFNYQCSHFIKGYKNCDEIVYVKQYRSDSTFENFDNNTNTLIYLKSLKELLTSKIKLKTIDQRLDIMISAYINWSMNKTPSKELIDLLQDFYNFILKDYSYTVIDIERVYFNILNIKDKIPLMDIINMFNILEKEANKHGYEVSKV